MAARENYNPYRRPTAYEVLGIENSLYATAREIGGKAYNNQKKKARLIRDTKERARRMRELEEAKNQLLRPEDRILLDFFLLGDRLFEELCDSHGRKLAEKELPTSELLGSLHASRRNDDLVPEAPEKAAGTFQLVDDPVFFTEPHALPRLPLIAVEL